MSKETEGREEPAEHEFRALLNYLRTNRGFDLSGYKPTTLKRRILRRIAVVDEQVRTFGDYLDYLEVHPDEFSALFDTILINVTAFFRDPEAWEYLSNDIVPLILESVGPDSPIRCWSAGCSSGEEAYTLAMVLAEAVGRAEFCQRVKIYATDVDDKNLLIARSAIYSAQALQSVPPELRERYFTPAPSGYQFAGDLRRCIIFGQHDLVQDAPISRLDLLVCRNTLMYFNAETQGRILARFHFALRENAFLFLGRAEMLLTRGNLFQPVDLRHRVFIRTPRAPGREQLLELGQPSIQNEVAPHLGQHYKLRDAALDAVSDATMVVDSGGNLVAINARAREMFGLRSSDLARPFRDLEVSYRPVELRYPVEQALNSHSVVTIPDVERHPGPDETQHLEVSVVPLGGNGQPLGVAITMLDVTRHRRLEQELQRSNAELETAYEELQSANEELETTNEELQSTVEELETTNEELQSTNEELQSTNEELETSNEELVSLNEELRERTLEATQTSAFLASVLGSMSAAMVVLDRDLTVLVWSRMAEELWGMRSEEAVGLPFLQLDVGFPVMELEAPLRAFLEEELDDYRTTLRAVSRRGRSVTVDVVLTPFSVEHDRWQGVVMLMTVREP